MYPLQSLKCQIVLRFDTVTSIFSYLKEGKQKVKISNICSTLPEILSGAPPGPILGPNPK